VRVTAAEQDVDLAKVAFRVWVRLRCPGDVDGIRAVLAVVLEEHERRVLKRVACERCRQASQA
jgi:hypothetical protein